MQKTFTTAFAPREAPKEYPIRTVLLRSWLSARTTLPSALFDSGLFAGKAKNAVASNDQSKLQVANLEFNKN